MRTWNNKNLCSCLLKLIFKSFDFHFWSSTYGLKHANKHLHVHVHISPEVFILSFICKHTHKPLCGIIVARFKTHTQIIATSKKKKSFLKDIFHRKVLWAVNQGCINKITLWVWHVNAASPFHTLRTPTPTINDLQQDPTEESPIIDPCLFCSVNMNSSKNKVCSFDLLMLWDPLYLAWPAACSGWQKKKEI